MSKDARNQIQLTDAAKKKLHEFVAEAAVCGFGVDGPPVDTTFAEIEEFGHQVGRLVGCAIDEQLADQHAAHFREPAPCPSCQALCTPKEELPERELQTKDGQVPLHEPLFHCPACHRDFFPSAYIVEA